MSDGFVGMPLTLGAACCPVVKCKTCNGTGVVSAYPEWIIIRMIKPCPDCKEVKDACS